MQVQDDWYKGGLFDLESFMRWVSSSAARIYGSNRSFDLETGRRKAQYAGFIIYEDGKLAPYHYEDRPLHATNTVLGNVFNIQIETASSLRKPTRTLRNPENGDVFKTSLFSEVDGVGRFVLDRESNTLRPLGSMWRMEDGAFVDIANQGVQEYKGIRESRLGTPMDTYDWYYVTENDRSPINRLSLLLRKCMKTLEHLNYEVDQRTLHVSNPDVQQQIITDNLYEASEEYILGKLMTKTDNDDVSSAVVKRLAKVAGKKDYIRALATPHPATYMEVI